MTVVVLMVLGLAALARDWLHALNSAKPLISPQRFVLQSFPVGLLGNLFARMGSGVQMLGMSLGVTCAAADWMGAGGATHALTAFRAALVMIGALTMASALIFAPLGSDQAAPPRRDVPIDHPYVRAHEATRPEFSNQAVKLVTLWTQCQSRYIMILPVTAVKCADEF